MTLYSFGGSDFLSASTQWNTYSEQALVAKVVEQPSTTMAIPTETDESVMICMEVADLRAITAAV